MFVVELRIKVLWRKAWLWWRSWLWLLWREMKKSYDLGEGEKKGFLVFEGSEEGVIVVDESVEVVAMVEGGEAMIILWIVGRKT